MKGAARPGLRTSRSSLPCKQQARGLARASTSGHSFSLQLTPTAPAPLRNCLLDYAVLLLPTTKQGSNVVCCYSANCILLCNEPSASFDRWSNMVRPVNADNKQKASSAETSTRLRRFMFTLPQTSYGECAACESLLDNLDV